MHLHTMDSTEDSICLRVLHVLLADAFDICIGPLFRTDESVSFEIFRKK